MNDNINLTGRSAGFFWHLLLILIVMTLTYALSSYLYLIRLYRIEPHVLYYYSASKIDEDNKAFFVPEVRNIAVPILHLDELNAIHTYASIEYLLEELLLGPSNIYAKHYNSRYLNLYNYSINKKHNKLYISLISTENIVLSPEYIGNIKKWLEYNVSKYYQFEGIEIIINKKVV